MSRQELKEKGVQGKKALIRYAKTAAVVVMAVGVYHLGLPEVGSELTLEQLGGLGTVALLFVATAEWVKE